MAQDIYTLILPVALLYTEDGKFDALRVVKCKVRSSEPVYPMSKDGWREVYASHVRTGRMTQEQFEEKKRTELLLTTRNNVVASAMRTLIVDEVISSTVVEVSLQNFTTDKAIRQALVHSSNAANKVFIKGVRTITRIYKSGVVGEGILYPLLSVKDYVTQRFVGFFDYTGKWHEGTADIPCREPYTSEFKLLRNKSYVPDARADTDITETLLGSIGRASSYDISCVVSQQLIQNTSAIAAQTLMGVQAVSEFIVNTFRNPELFAPVMTAPEGAYKTKIQEPRTQAKDKQIRQLWVPQSMKDIELDCVQSPQIVGINNTHLHNYALTCTELNRFDLPALISGDITEKDTTFGLKCARANYIGSLLNLSAIMTDALDVHLSLGGQPWDAISLPCARTVNRLYACVNRPVFKVITTPQRYTRTRNNATNTGINVGLVFDTTTGTAQKQALLNLSAMTPWNITEVALSTHAPQGHNNFDGTQNKVQIALGAARASDGYNRAGTLIFATDCSVTEDILLQDIPVMYYTVHKLKLKKGENFGVSGATHITGNIGTLHILIEPYAGTGPIKDIYIDGTVKNVIVSFSEAVEGEKKRGTVEENLSRVRIHTQSKIRSLILQDAYAYAHGRQYKLTEAGIVRKPNITTARGTHVTGDAVLKMIV